MTRAAVLGFIIVPFIALTSCKTRLSTSDAKVVGGEEAKPAMFPASIHIPSCSAVVVGRNSILTAAHCVVQTDSDPLVLRDEYRPGGHFSIQHGIKLADSETFDLATVATYLHPTYVSVMGKKTSETAVDLALIVVSGIPQKIPAAKISSTSLTRTDRLLFTGYGCEQLPQHIERSWSGEGDVVASGEELSGFEKTLRLKYKKVAFQGYVGSVGEIRNIGEAAGVVIGSQTNPNDLFFGCPGDSGSAVYLSDNGESEGASYWTVVGVNSSIGMSRTAFTRLDDESDFHVFDCLRQRLSNVGGRDAAVDPRVPFLMCAAPSTP